MFCDKCGKQLGDDVLFCTGCGNKLEKNTQSDAQNSKSNEINTAAQGGNAAANAQAEQSASFSPAATLQKPQPPVENRQSGAAKIIKSEPSAKERVKKIIKSPLFLIAAICMSLCIIMNFVVCFMPGATENLYMAIANACNESGIAELKDIYDSMMAYKDSADFALKALLIITMIITLVPFFLMNLGLILFRANIEKNANTGCIKAGITVNIVYSAIGACFTAFVYAAGICSLLEINDVVAIYVLIAVAAVTAAMFVMRFFYLGFLLSTVSKTAKAINTGVLLKKASLYVTVMHFFTAVMYVIAALASAVGIMVVNELWIYALHYLIVAAAYVLFGVVLIKLREVESVK